jgi:hypothetical protein
VTAQAPPPVQELYPGVLFQGDVLRPLYRAVLVGIADARASGYNISLLVEAQQALKSVIGQSDVRKPLPRISSSGSTTTRRSASPKPQSCCAAANVTSAASRARRGWGGELGAPGCSTGSPCWPTSRN